MVRKQNLLLLILLFGIIAPPLKTMDSSEPVQKEKAEKTEKVKQNSTEQNPNRGLLIFLDDTESDSTKDHNLILGAISAQFLSALVENAGPIIVSASLIDNVRERQKPTITDPQKIHEWFSLLGENPTPEDVIKYKNIVLSIIPFNKKTVKNWVIKKINDSLYLLIPNQYLAALKIAVADVEQYTPDKQITPTEQKLGLKINHMQTVTDIDEIKKPLPEPNKATYFIDALWDSKLRRSAIFVTNDEYAKNKITTMPCWALFIAGHGLIKTGVAFLDLTQFQQFLTFLAYRICTRLLYYATCYGAGITEKLLYEDAEQAITRTYPFAIMTQTLTDAPLFQPSIDFNLVESELIPQMPASYAKFLQNVTSQEPIKYQNINPFLKLYINSIPQIKFPGLPWFSAADHSKACAIGPVLAKTRTEPLDIATFFAKRGKPAAPMAILLYSNNIPFELIINTHGKDSPAIVSMIPGDAIHHIKKISSTVYDAHELIMSFLEVEDLHPQKIFVIDLITAINAKGQTINIYDIVIQLTPAKNNAYYMHNDTTFKMIGENSVEEADDEDTENYLQLLQKVRATENPVTKQKIKDLKKSATNQFKKLMTDQEMEQAIIRLLDNMPSNIMLHIADLNGLSCPPDEECWLELMGTLAHTLAQYKTFGNRKIVWFDRLIVHPDETAEEAMILMYDIIIDVGPEEATVFFTTDVQEMGRATAHGTFLQHEPYLPLYKNILTYFDANLQLLPLTRGHGATPTQELLTPEAISTIEHAQLKKVTEYRSSFRKKEKEVKKENE